VVRAPWGAALDFDAVDAAMITTRAQWLWAVHTETSTGVVNDLDVLRTLAQRHRARLALDAVSSVGALPIRLDGVWCASAVSGKALASFPGVAVVLHEELPTTPHVRVPRYLDLHLAAASDGVPFTQSSNLLSALHASLTSTDWPTRIAQRQRDGRWLREALAQQGLHTLAAPDCASPIVHTIPLPPTVSAQQVGLTLRQQQWHVGFESAYLRARNWLQLCLMGEYEDAALRALPNAVSSAITHANRSASASSGTGAFPPYEASHFSHHLVNGRALV
jgi:aspartate aminotransferase-like enzyme